MLRTFGAGYGSRERVGKSAGGPGMQEVATCACFVIFQVLLVFLFAALIQIGPKSWGPLP